MFRRKKKQSLPRRIVRKIRECYLYCKVYVAEKVATSVARKYMIAARNESGRWRGFKARLTASKFFAQAAICRYARRSGTYRNL